jgi:hypothetical protein
VVGKTHSWIFNGKTADIADSIMRMALLAYPLYASEGRVIWIKDKLLSLVACTMSPNEVYGSCHTRRMNSH